MSQHIRLNNGHDEYVPASLESHNDDETTPALHTARKNPYIKIFSFSLLFLFFFSLFFIVPYKQWNYTPALIFESVKSRFEQFLAFVTGRSGAFGITIYQYTAVMLAGAALAGTGAVLQGSFRNVLAGPSTMGVMSGGTLGMMLYLIILAPTAGLTRYATADLSAFYSKSLIELYGRQLFTIAGCFAGVAITVGIAIAAGRGRLSASAMIISGTVFSGISGSIAQIIQYVLIIRDPADARIELIRNLMMGSFNGINSFTALCLMGIPLIVCLTVYILLRHRMNLLMLSEDEAYGMGSNLRKFRILMIAVSTVISAVIISFCGQIGFIGFMIPLAGRRFTGPDMGRLLPVSMLLGACFLTVVFDAAYIAGMTDYIGVFTGSIGGIVLLITLLKRSRLHER